MLFRTKNKIIKPLISSTSIEIDEIIINIQFRKIKNIHLKILPPYGDVRLSLPLNTSKEFATGFINSKLDWIKKHRIRFNTERIDIEKKFTHNEKHLFFGKNLELKLLENKSRPKVSVDENNIIVFCNDISNTILIEKAIDDFLRKELIDASKIFFDKWESILGVKSSDIGIRKMKTRWGTCNIRTKKIWLSFELAHKPIECLEYIIVHELCHLIEKNHNERFYNILHHHFPNYKMIKHKLNNFVYLPNQ
ncbi:MAG: hypothetical protein H6Q15_1697 [Bacteroidetes bacterium]|nr:hypothetical protein [Bacteroidota bacterium]